MKTTTIVIALTSIILATTALADRQEKTLICHVGSELGPNDETYLDDPDCVPSDTVSCPDAGKIDLILVANPANHLDNPNHEFDGFSDYDPIAVGASGVGTEDSNDDGIDDGCEIPEACPCWNQTDLTSVTADNQFTQQSCSAASFYPIGVLIQNVEGSTPGVEGGFAALVSSPTVGFCTLRDAELFIPLTAEEASACVEQIAARCDAIGDSVYPD